jgi:hypothetical protein
MTATKPEIGTDSSATLYAQGESIRKTVETLAAPVNGTHADIAQIKSDVANLAAILAEALTTLQRIDVAVVNTADQTILTDERVVSLSNKADVIQTETAESLVQHKMTQMTLGTFVGWFTPILDEFRDTSIIPMLHKIDGKTSDLLESHIAIKTLAQQAVDKVTPMLDKLEKSPILSMLGVKSNG